MQVIVTLDDNLGMMFNHRRQSRDRLLIEDIVHTIGKSRIFIDSYSETLFENAHCNYVVSSDPLDDSETSDYCFIENRHLSNYINKIDKLIIYRWNRTYPHDFEFDIVLSKSNFKLESIDNFHGSSHEITKEIYAK